MIRIQNLNVWFADDTNLGGVVDSLRAERSYNEIWIDRQESWAITNHMIFTRGSAIFCTWNRVILAYIQFGERSKSLKQSQ